MPHYGPSPEEGCDLMAFSGVLLKDPGALLEQIEEPSSRVILDWGERDLQIPLLLALLPHALPSGHSLRAQDALGAPACSSCAEAAGRTVRPGAPGDSLGLAGLPRGAVRPDGVILLVSYVPSAPGALMYAPDGSLLGLLGGRGEGPGEMRYPLRLARGEKDTYLQAQDGVVHVFGADGAFRHLLRGIFSTTVASSRRGKTERVRCGPRPGNSSFRPPEGNPLPPRQPSPA